MLSSSSSSTMAGNLICECVLGLLGDGLSSLSFMSTTDMFRFLVAARVDCDGK